MKKLKPIIIINCIMIFVALYTYISIYAPSLLKFSNEEYVPTGGDHLTDGLLLQLLHYANLFIFYVINIGFMIRSFIQKQTKIILITVISIVLMLGIYLWKSNVTRNNTIQIEEKYYGN